MKFRNYTIEKYIYIRNIRSHFTDHTGIYRIEIKIAYTHEIHTSGISVTHDRDTKPGNSPRNPSLVKSSYTSYNIARGLERIANPGENSKNEERQPMRKRIDTVGRRKGRANTLFTSACVPDAPKPRGSYLSRRRSYFIRARYLLPLPAAFQHLPRNKITFFRNNSDN